MEEEISVRMEGHAHEIGSLIPDERAGREGIRWQTVY